MNLSIDKVEVDRRNRAPSANILAIYRRIKVDGVEVAAVTITPDWMFHVSGSTVQADLELNPAKKTLLRIDSKYSNGLNITADGTTIVDEPANQSGQGPLRFSRVLQGYKDVTVSIDIGTASNWNLNDHPGSLYDDAHITARIVG